MKSTTKPKKIQELTYGIHPIVELLKAGKRKIYTIYTTKPTPKSWIEIEPLLKPLTQIQYVSKDVLDRMAGTIDHQSVIAWASPFIYRSKFFDPSKSPLLMMIDSVQDTRNLGAIIRSSYCTGFDGIIVCQKGGAPINASTIKASAGLSERSEIYLAGSPVHAVQLLKEAGYNIYLATLDGKDATKIEFKSPLCAVIGNEATGITPAIFKFGTKIKLPQKSDDVSFNASVAAGILLFMISNQVGKLG